MFMLSSQQQESFRSAVNGAARRVDVLSAVRNLYMALQDAVDLRRPTCVTSGRCCRFEEFGHRLFVTTLEMAAFMAESCLPVTDNRGACPFQNERLCSVHPIRPFGCRVFFCDATSTQWQQEQYARFHAEFRRLHDDLSVPYFYLEWRLALQIVAADLETPAPS
jgi:Fe-S-cluster containining protein